MAKQIGIDLGTSTTMICQKDKGIVLRMPSVVSIERGTQEVIATGKAAKQMLGKTPGSIRAQCPLKGGVITELDVTSLMLHDFFERLDMVSMFNRPAALVCIPHGITVVERRAVEDATFEAGAKNVGLIEAPIVSAIGAGIPVSSARGAMIIDLGGGVSEAAVISLGGVVQTNSLRIAGKEMDDAIVAYLKKNRNIYIGDITAEKLKIKLGTAMADIDRGSMEVCGRDILTKRAKTISVTTEDVRAAIREPLLKILAMIKSTLEETPPELAADIFDYGIVVAGGVARLPGIDRAIHERTGIRVRIPPKPADCACLGLDQVLKSTGGDFSEFVSYKGK